MMKPIHIIVAAIALTLLLPACGGRQQVNPKPVKAALDVIRIPSGTTIPVMGLSFDVSYDPRLDNLIPGYKILTVAINNTSLEYVQMDPFNDQWVVVDRSGHKHKAILNMREKSPEVWAKLPPKLRRLLEYPLMVRIAEDTPVDLIFPDSASLGEFREVIFKFSTKDKEVHILPRE